MKLFKIDKSNIDFSNAWHEWGDEWFEENGDELYKAEKYIWQFVHKWSRCALISKEKYGTIRYEAIFPPGVGYFTRHTWYNKLCQKLGGRTSGFSVLPNGVIFKYSYPKWHGFGDTPIAHLWEKYGKMIARLAIKKACSKFPNVVPEILDDYDEDFI